MLGITLVEGQDLPQDGHGDIYVRFRLCDQKYKSKVGLVFQKSFSFSHFPCTPFTRAPVSFFVSALYTSSVSSQPPISYFPASLAQQVPVSDSPPPWLTGPWLRQLIRLGQPATHFSPCFGCWASLPSFAYPACPVHLPVLVGLPPDDSMLHLSCVVVSFLCKPLRFPLCLFVC